MALILFRYFWIFIVLSIFASAVVWRMEARDRIKADPTLSEPLNRLYGGFAFWLSLPFLVMGGGIVFGYVDTVFGYFRFDAGNPFILSFHALIFAEDALFLIWVFFRDGDEFVALHTEIVNARPKFRTAVKIAAVALPILYAFSVYQITTSPHFGQFFGAISA